MFLHDLTKGNGTLGNATSGRITLSNLVEFSQPSIETMYSAKNLTSVISNIAGTMTNLVRTNQGFITIPDEDVGPNPKKENLPANGTAYSHHTFIEVRWPWLILSLVFSNRWRRVSTRHCYDESDGEDITLEEQRHDFTDA